MAACLACWTVRQLGPISGSLLTRVPTSALVSPQFFLCRRVIYILFRIFSCRNPGRPRFHVGSLGRNPNNGLACSGVTAKHACRRAPKIIQEKEANLPGEQSLSHASTRVRWKTVQTDPSVTDSSLFDPKETCFHHCPTCNLLWFSACKPLSPCAASRPSGPTAHARELRLTTCSLRNENASEARSQANTQAPNCRLLRPVTCLGLSGLS